MSLKSLMNAVAVATITAGTLLSGSGAAQAGDWGRRHGGGHVERGEGGWDRHEGRGSWAQDRSWRGHHRDHTGRNIAIGAFATVLGLALAAESARVHDQYYDERD